MADTRQDKFTATGNRFLTDRRGMTSIETAVMFGVFAVGFALVATTYIDDRGRRLANNDFGYGQQVDNMVTGSISGSKHFTIRRSVLLPSKTSRCIIFDNGKKIGDC